MFSKIVKISKFLPKSRTNQQIERLIRTKYETTTRIYFNPTQENSKQKIYHINKPRKAARDSKPPTASPGKYKYGHLGLSKIQIQKATLGRKQIKQKDEHISFDKLLHRS